MVKQPLHLITRSDLCPFYEKQGFAKQRGSNKSVYEPKDDEVYMMGSRATLCPRNEQNSIIMAFASLTELKSKEPSWAAAYESALVDQHGVRRKDLQPVDGVYMVAI